MLDALVGKKSLCMSVRYEQRNVMHVHIVADSQLKRIQKEEEEEEVKL